MLPKLTTRQVRKLKQINKLKGSVSSKEYRDILNLNSSTTKTKTPTTINSAEYKKMLIKQNSKNKKNFNFTLTIDEVKCNSEYLFTLHGRHLSTNSIDSLSFKDKLRYKSAIKKAFYDYFLVHKKKLPHQKMKKVSLKATAYIVSHTHRDDDAYRTLKPIRDMIVNMGYVKDDSREYMKQLEVDEVLCKEWKIEILIKEIV